MTSGVFEPISAQAEAVAAEVIDAAIKIHKAVPLMKHGIKRMLI
jgi:hypothetical protein